MGHNRFCGKTCVYCATDSSVTGDHVFARSFFLEEHRANLPLVPACTKCNNEKSKLEHYLTSVLPFGGRHAHARDNLQKQVPRRLKKNLRLHRELSEGRTVAELVDDGRLGRRTVLPLRPGSLEELFRYIVRGLVWHHWRVCCPKSFEVDIMVLTKHGQEVMDREIFALQRVERIRQNLGKGTVIYEGIHDQESPGVSAWRFHMYGGMMVADDIGDKNSASTEIAAISAPKTVADNA